MNRIPPTHPILLGTLAALHSLAVPAIAQSRGKQLKTSDAPFLSPQEAVAKIEIPEGFEVSVFAAEPDIGEPIAFTFGPRSRVWVLENYNYVNRRKHITDRTLSRIQILEDTDGDGVHDTRKTFLEDLPFTSGIAVGHGGVYLGAPPHLLFIPDADGDGVPDGAPEILLDGWGDHDRHETLNSFIWVPDGWLYGCHGVFTRSFVGKPGAADDERQYIDAGIWRWHPVREEFEVFARGLSNPWGFDFNDVGHAFATCCVIPHLFHVVQSGVYHKQSTPHLNPYVYDPIPTIRDHTHLSAHGGARFYLADAFPAEYRGQLFMCNIHEHAVLTDVMSRKGSSYIGHHGADFMPANDLAWVGFSVEIGPDGAVYILDWHDTDICGNAINFPKSGRIYRIQHKDARPASPPDLTTLTDHQLVDLQMHANDWFVRQARTLLQHRAATGKLDKMATRQALDTIFEEATTSPGRLRALWANHATGRFAGNTDLLPHLDHPDENVRSWAIQLLCETMGGNTAPPPQLHQKLTRLATADPSPTVRLYLASALHRLPADARWPIMTELAKHAEDADDNNIPRVLWVALEPLVTEFPEKALAVATGGNIPFLQKSVARRMIGAGVTEKGVAKKKEKAQWERVLAEFAPGFAVHNVGEGGVRRLTEFRNGKGFQTHPKDRRTPCSPTRQIQVPPGKITTLNIRASYHAHGDWQLRVLADADVLHDQVVSPDTVEGEWLDLALNLTPYAGKNIKLTLQNRANNWAWEFAYWGGIHITTD